MKLSTPRLADPALLQYDVECHKCLNPPIECKCEDKWLRLRRFKAKLCFARAQVCLGYGGDEERQLTNKFGF